MKVVIKHAGRWLHFSQPEKILRAESVDDVLPMLQEAEASGLYAAGFISYEAASAFDAALKTQSSDGFPLLCLGLFRAPEILESIEEAPPSSFEMGPLEPSVSKEEFVEAIAEIRERIAEGATYQVNFTYRLKAGFSGDAWAFFCELVKGQKSDHAAYIDTDEHAICSASPELFFSFSDGKIISRPMKGTARRGRTFAEDWEHAEALRHSAKDRAENIMIVDMIRNDIGRVAEPGSIETVSTYDVEKYPTVWQMTSTVQGDLEPRMNADGHGLISKILRALFPCASITGAPKAKTMEIIQGLETSPRKIYTGSIGFVTPQGEACFNVAIRTALIDRKAGEMEFGVGGGIVWDSDAGAEYEETLTKARVLTQPRPDFKLLETMLLEPETGIFLLNEHLQRLGKSAAYFDIPLDIHAVLQALEETGESLERVPHRLRLLVSKDGNSEIQTYPIERCSNASPTEGRKASSADSDRFPPDGRLNDTTALRVALAREPIDSQDVFLFHKTTYRVAYENAKADFSSSATATADKPEFDDVILWNEKGEVTESCLGNVVISKGGRKITPPVMCGLLAGTFREHLLKAGEIEEGIVTTNDLIAAKEVFLVNSVRKWQKAVIAQPKETM